MTHVANRLMRPWFDFYKVGPQMTREAGVCCVFEVVMIFQAHS